MPPASAEKRSQGSVHLDLVRGAAAILVMLGHSRDLFFQSLNGHTPAMTTAATAAAATSQAPRLEITLGNEAVMIFFVLSGYLVGGSVLRSFRRNRWSWTDYLTKRLARLWVVLLPALLLTVALDNLGLRMFPEATSIYQGPAGQTEVRAHLVHTLTPHIVLGNAFFLQGILVPPPGTNIALWSLSNEFWYYLLFPLLVLLCWRRVTRRARIVSGLVFAVLLVLIGSEEALLFLPWLLGAGIALLPPRLTERTSRSLMVVFSVLLLPVMVLIRRLPLDLRLGQLCISVYFGVLLYLLLHRREPARDGFYQRVAALLSDLSYPLYLVHLPVLVLLCASMNRPWHPWTRSPAHVALMLVLDVAAAGTAYLFHLGFQRHTEAVRLGMMRYFPRRNGFEPSALEAEQEEDTVGAISKAS